MAIAICSNESCGATRHYEPSKKKKAPRMLCSECGEPCRYPTPEEREALLGRMTAKALARGTKK